jgi:hypothetical protein
MLGSYQRARLLLGLASVACFALVWLAGSALDIPRIEGYAASLLNGYSPFLDLVITLVLMLACVLVGTLVAGTIRFDAGLAAAAIGLTALSIRGGPMRYVLFSASGPTVFLTLAAELMILYAIIGLAWGVLWLLHERGMLLDDPLRDGIVDVDESPGQRLLALATQVVVMGLLMILLAKSDQKSQVVWSVGISSFLATLAAHSVAPSRPSVWYWTGPLAVGVVGYVLAYASNDASWQIGHVGGWAPELARPVPLDYAGAGTAGAIIGYWMSRRWQRGPVDEDVAEPAPATA